MKKRELDNGPPSGMCLWVLRFRGEETNGVGQTAYQAYLDGVRKLTNPPPFGHHELTMMIVRPLEKYELPTRRVQASSMAIRVGTHIKLSGVLTPPACYNEKWCQELLEAADIMTGDKEDDANKV